jgi:peptide-methionine (R)-S-oxide reductase
MCYIYHCAINYCSSGKTEINSSRTGTISSDTKFDSGSWPSFWAPVEEGAVSEQDDRSWFMRRTEVRCASCNAHRGHLFPDGPPPTGARYCMNGVALTFEAAEAGKK